MKKIALLIILISQSCSDKKESCIEGFIYDGYTYKEAKEICESYENDTLVSP